MKYLTLELIKQHLQINSTYTDDDAYLEVLGGVVEEVVEKHIDDDFEHLAEANDGNLPMPLIQAMLLLLGTYFSNRENIAFVNSSEVPMSYTYLLDLYKNYAGGGENDKLVLQELNDKVNQLLEYMEYDKNRTISGTGLDVTTDGQNTNITIDVIDEGEYA